MATHEMHGEDAWAWPCPYCGTSNALDAAVCVGCRAQLRDPEEDDLFTTLAPDIAQVVDPDAPRIRESLWSTEVPPEEVVAEEVLDATEVPAAGRGSTAAAQSREWARGTAPGPFSSTHGAGGARPGGPPPTPDEHGLSVAADRLAAEDRDRCSIPIAVCGALLGEREVVLGLVAGHLLGHPAVLALTNTRVLVANARRWKPLVDQYVPGPDLLVHLRHDRDVASITLQQSERLTGVDDITDVGAAVDLAQRIGAAAGDPASR